MKNDRLFQLLYLLLEKGSSTAPQLAQALEVSVRTVYRDVETLSISGVPVYASAGKGGGISLMPGYSVDKALFSDAEQRELLFALQSLRAADQHMDALLSKLGAAFQQGTQEAQNWIEVDFARWGLQHTDRDRFDLLKQAILEHRVLDVAYCGASGKHSQRKVQPVKLIFKEKHWYLQAFCLTAQDYRLFKISRIVSLSDTGERFTPRAESPPPIETEVAPYESLHLTLHFSSAVAFRVYDEFDSDCVKAQPDGSFLVQVAFPIDNWVFNYLFSFGTDVTILSPTALRSELAKYAEKIANHHKT